MCPSLPVLVFSLLAVSPRPSLSQDPAGEISAPRVAGANGARAKQGLLPRKARPSRVTYLDGAARRRGEVRDFPAAPGVEAGAPAVVLASEPRREADAPEAAGDASAAAAAADARAAPVPVAPRAQGAPARPTARVEPAPQVDAPAEGAPAEEETSADASVEEAADRARDDEAVSVGVLSERTVDRRGRIIERRFRRDLQLLSIRVVARIDELPVVSSERLPDGRIRERVEVEGSALEVLRDPVGRFVSARAAPGPADDGVGVGDEG